MMAALFFLFVIDMLLIWKGLRVPAIVLGLVTLLLCLAMFSYHATDVLQIML